MTTQELQAAFVAELDRHRGILLKVARAYCRDSATREDLAQEIVAQLWRAYPRFDASRSFSTWMYRIVVNVAISFHRTQMRATRNVVATEGALFDRLPAQYEDGYDDRLELVYALVGELDGLNRALMMLYLDDYPYAEIAAILGISESNVATKIGRIKERLRRATAGIGLR
ncbi:MAG: RNA polymerase sigma factor [Candidatus Baltobacteraceae bacterium]